MITQPKFSRGDKVKVAVNRGSCFTGGTRTEYDTRTVADIRSREGRFEYLMVGAGYWVKEHRLSAIEDIDAMPLVTQGDIALKNAERIGPFVI